MWRSLTRRIGRIFRNHLPSCEDMSDNTIEFGMVCAVIIAMCAAWALVAIFCDGKTEAEQTEREERVGLQAWSEEWREAREWAIERRGE